MIKYTELIGKDLKTVFPNVDWNIVSIGNCSGPGLRLGFSDWAESDILLDPSTPLDAIISCLKLNGQFLQVDCNQYLNVVHGDCTLTHAASGVRQLAKNGGKIKVTGLDTVKLAEDAIAYMKGRHYMNAQILEKFLFRQPFDESGLVYQQTMMDAGRIKAAIGLQCSDLKIAVSTDQMFPDDVRLPGISETTWAIADEINILEEGLSHDWPQCVLCRRLATKMDADRRYYSRYCKDHYAEARGQCDDGIRESYNFVIEFKRT